MVLFFAAQMTLAMQICFRSTAEKARLSRGVISQMIKKTLAGTAAAVGAAAVLGSVASRGVNSPWYVALDKPSIQPPEPVFPIVWTLLYSDIAISSAVVIDGYGALIRGRLSPISAHSP
jgi:hypothetical protein